MVKYTKVSVQAEVMELLRFVAEHEDRTLANCVERMIRQKHANTVAYQRRVSRERGK